MDLERFEVVLRSNESKDGLFYVYDNQRNEIVSKGYKYSRYAYNIQNKLEDQHIRITNFLDF